MRRAARRILVLLFGLLVPLSASAGETKLSGAEVTEALTGNTAIYKGGVIKQFFSESGATPYWDGSRLTRGIWRVTGDQYCSVWPPSNAWSCYDMYSTEDGGIVWVGSRGDRYLATMVSGDQMAAQ